MKQYTINNNSIYYGNEPVYFLGSQQNAQTIKECVENVHRFLLDNADISMLGNNSIFELRLFSCAPVDFPSVVEALHNLNRELQEDPDDEPYFLINNDTKVSNFFGDVLVKQDYKTHCYKCYDMGITDLQDLHDLLVFG